MYVYLNNGQLSTCMTNGKALVLCFMWLWGGVIFSAKVNVIIHSSYPKKINKLVQLNLLLIMVVLSMSRVNILGKCLILGSK